MNNALALDAVAPRFPRRLTAGLAAVLLLALTFVIVVALPYFAFNEAAIGRYWTRRWWLLMHISAGIGALLSGPVQLWLGLAERRADLHRRLGVFYMVSVLVSAVAGYYLAFNTDFGFAFGSGLASLATAWLLTTGLALLAIRRHTYEQHKEWMIRSYVVTTAFVAFRLLFKFFELADVGTTHERLAATAWMCWALPLLFTEAIIQGKKVRR